MVIALYQLRERLGEERVNTALRQYCEKYHDAAPPYPTPNDFYAELRAMIPESLRSDLDELFASVIMREARANAVLRRPRPQGALDAALDALAREVRARR